MELNTVIAGTISRVLFSFISSLSKDGFRVFIGKKLHDKIVNKDKSIEYLTKNILENIGYTIEWPEKPRIEVVCLFIQSQEVEVLIRQYLSLVIKQAQDNSSVKEEFVILFSKYTKISEDESSILAIKLWDHLISTVDKTLVDHVNLGKLSAHEAKSNLRYQIILGELEGINKNVELLRNNKSLDISEINKTDEKMRTQINNRHAHIMPPNFDTTRKIEIDRLYVDPTFFYSVSNKNLNESETITDLEFLSKAFRDVILGNPGGGKSTFVQKLCFDLSKKSEIRKYNNRILTPILVILRDFGSEKKEKQLSILDHIADLVNARYQIKLNRNNLEYMLLNGRCLVIFDGLDELLDTAYRQMIAGDIESFCTLYPNTPVLITSREVGYDQAPLREDLFEIYRLAPFNEDQVKSYVHKWFQCDTDLIDVQRTNKSNSFLQESRVVSDLRSNPLMLALMCNIYRGENYIPTNRPDVYEKCATMLFERWDKGRGIKVVLPIEQHIRPTMSYIAEWIYSDEKLQGGVTEHHLIQKAAEYLSPRRFEDKEEAIKVAEEFICYCRGRAWVFTDTGTTRIGERLYQFTHRTFLEYFTALNIFRNNSTPDKLLSVLMSRIEKEEWDVVSQLSVQITNKNIEDAGDSILNNIINFDKSASISRKVNRIAFCVRCLGFIVPSPKVTNTIVSILISNTIEWGIKIQNKNSEEYKIIFPSQSDESKLYNIISPLLYAHSENLVTIRKSLVKEITEVLENEKSEQKIELALELGLRTTSFLMISSSRSKDEILNKIWNDFSSDLKALLNDRIIVYLSKFFWLGWLYFLEGKVNFEEMKKWYGINFIIREHTITLSRGWYLPIIFIVTYQSQGNSIPKRAPHYSKFLEDLANYSLDNKIEFDKSYIPPMPYILHKEKSGGEEFSTLSVRGLFGLVLCYCIWFEMYKINGTQYGKDNFNTKDTVLSKVYKLFRMRDENDQTDEKEKIIREFGFQGRQYKLLSAWVDKKINFVV